MDRLWVDSWATLGANGSDRMDQGQNGAERNTSFGLRSPASTSPVGFLRYCTSFGSALDIFAGKTRKNFSDNAKTFFLLRGAHGVRYAKKFVLVVKVFVPSGLSLLLGVHSGPLTTIVSRRKTLVDLAPSANGSLSGLPPQLTPPPPPPCVFVISQALSLSRVSKNISTASP